MKRSAILAGLVWIICYPPAATAQNLDTTSVSGIFQLGEVVVQAPSSDSVDMLSSRKLEEFNRLKISTAKQKGVALKLEIQGEVATPLSLGYDDLRKMKQTTVAAKDRNGKMTNFEGVVLWELLDSAGVTLGSRLRGENLAKYVLVKAVDGYEVVFSLAEIDPEFTEQIILLAVHVDGKPLAPGEGPFRMIVPDDKKHARWIREILSIHILFADE